MNETTLVLDGVETTFRLGEWYHISILSAPVPNSFWGNVISVNQLNVIFTILDGNNVEGEFFQISETGIEGNPNPRIFITRADEKTASLLNILFDSSMPIL